MSYDKDRAWSDQFLPHMRALIGPHLLVPSSFEVDTKQAADLVVLRARDMTIACRIRRHGYADRYPWEFTVRSARDSGMRTELEKLIDGWGDWMFYAHASANATRVERWLLIDLAAWRAALIRDRAKLSIANKSNGDGTHFVSFDVRSFPAGGGRSPILVASSHTVPTPHREAA